MRAASLAYQQVMVTDLPDPVPGPGEVLIRMQASAICRTDLSVYHGTAAWSRPEGRVIAAGHEPAGVVAAAGEGVRWPRVGERVAIYCFTGCGHCAWCRQGHYYHCPEAQCLGFHRHGGDADYLVVPAGNCLPIPDQMNFVEGALSTDLLGTLYQTVRRLGITGADTVAIFGLGPMGATGLLLAKAMGARVIALDVDPGRAAAARALGADQVLDPGAVDAVAALRDLTDGGPTVAIDASGSSAGQQAAVRCIRPFGRVGIVGGATELCINPRQDLIRKQATILANMYFNISLYQEAVQFMERHQIRLEPLVTHRFSLEEAPEAFTLFDQRSTGKVVFVWDSPL